MILTTWGIKPSKQFHNLNITIYYVNLVNLVQNTNELYKNDSHNMGSKTSQTNSHNHIKIIGLTQHRCWSLCIWRQCLRPWLCLHCVVFAGLRSLHRAFGHSCIQLSLQWTSGFPLPIFFPFHLFNLVYENSFLLFPPLLYCLNLDLNDIFFFKFYDF